MVGILNNNFYNNSFGINNHQQRRKETSITMKKIVIPYLGNEKNNILHALTKIRENSDMEFIKLGELLNSFLNMNEISYSVPIQNVPIVVDYLEFIGFVFIVMEDE